MGKPGRFLWIGDAVAKTGFAQVTHNLVPRLIAAGWQGAVCGINHNGDPHRYPYPIYRADLGGDPWGLGRAEELHAKVKPDVVIINNDPWNVREFLPLLRGKCPVVGYMPIDSPNVPAVKDLNPGPAQDGLALAIWYTAFGRDEAIACGYEGPNAVVPHGVDADLYTPRPRAACLEALGLGGKIPIDAFVVGNVNRNSARKRLDLTVLYFAAWWEQAGKPEDAFLYLHTSNLDSGPNLLQLAVRCGLRGRVILTNRMMRPGEGISEATMPFVYSLFDVQVTTTQGEGWGLTTHEGMACGVPQIVPEYAALGEWPAHAVTFVPATLPYVNGHGVNSIGCAPDAGAFVDALELLYTDRPFRLEMAERARARAADPLYHWDAVAALFDGHLRGALRAPAVDTEAAGVVAGEPHADSLPEHPADPAGHETAGAAAARDPSPAPGGDARTARTKTGPVAVARSRAAAAVVEAFAPGAAAKAAHS